jgi:hypothetical protein
VSDVEAAVDHVRAKLAVRPQTWMKYRTLVQKAERKKSSAQFADALEQALAEAGVYFYCERGRLRDCSLDETLSLSTTKIWEPGLPFADHRELGDFIKRHYRLLPPFRRCRTAEREKALVDDRGRVIVDLYLTEPKGVVVCELEYDSGRFEPASQIKRYIHAAQADEATGSNRAVRGVVITGAPNPEQEEELSEFGAASGVQVDWYYYRLTLELERSPR